MSKKPRGYWTESAIKADALKYNSRSEWSKASGSGYHMAWKKGKDFLNACCAHMAEKEPQKPWGYWTLEKIIEVASPYRTVSEFRAFESGAYQHAKEKKLLPIVAERAYLLENVPMKMGCDRDVFYIWANLSQPGTYKGGITSARLGEKRLHQCAKSNDMNTAIVLMLQTSHALEIEEQFKALGTDPGYSSDIDGYTEFRALTDSELGQAVKIAYDMALTA